MNYMTEIKMFNEWLETNELSTGGIALWYGLMFIANRAGWRNDLSIPISAIMLRTKMSRSAIYRERNALRKHGLIDFDANDGRQSSNYRIRSFESGFASQVTFHTDTQSETVIAKASQVVSHSETQAGTENPEMSQVVSHPETQTGTQTPEASHTGTQSGSIYKHKHLSIDKKKRATSDKKKEGLNLSFIEDEKWRELVSTWLEYKASRKEAYVSEMSARKFLTMLKNLSSEDVKKAQRIIDRSIARNWKGIFALTDEEPAASKPASGQRIGQIKQPESDEKRTKLLKKFESKK